MSHDTIREWATSAGLDEGDVARELSRYLETEVTEDQVRQRWGRRWLDGPSPPNKSWVEALGIELAPQPPEPEPAAEQTSGVPLSAPDDGAPPPTAAQPRRRRRRATPPTATPELNLAVLEERIAGIYVLVGKGVAQTTHNPQYETAFTSHANQAARAWVDLARADARVANVLRALTAGGPWGGVIWCHVSLAMSLVVISGRIELPNPFAPPANPNGAEQPRQPESPADVVGSASEQA